MGRLICTIIFIAGIINLSSGLTPSLQSTFTAFSVVASDSAMELSDSAQLDGFLQKQYKCMRIHKAFAFTTGGLLLASASSGIYHFLDMKKQGHDFRNAIGFSEHDGRTAEQTNEIQAVWRKKQSQSFRVLHGALITASAICYTATASIELTMPRFSKNPSPYSNTHIHKYLFLAHASLMAANIGLGFLESYALSEGKHDLMMGAGIAHMVVGIAAPVMVFSSGLAFKFPWP